MRKIEKNAEKVKILSKIIYLNLRHNRLESEDFEGEAFEIIELIDNIKDVTSMAESIENYYLNNAVDDVWSDYETISILIAKEYLNKVAKL